jgi:hypothetical protein
MDYQEIIAEETETMIFYLDKQMEHMTYYDCPDIEETGRPLI